MASDISNIPRFKLYKLLDEIPSTYRYIQTYIANGTLPSGAIVDTLYQTAGRGQRGNSWYSSYACNLLPSLFLATPPIQPHQSVFLSDWIALSVAEVVAFFAEGLLPDEFHSLHIGAKTKVKWPNDIYFEEKKIAGILINHSLRERIIAHTVVGIGLNVNEQSFPSYLPNPTSLNIITSQQFNLESVRNYLIERLTENYRLVLGNGSQLSLLHSLYEKHLLGKNELRVFLDATTNKTFEGIIKGVANDGRLQVWNCSQQALQIFTFKELVYMHE